MSRRPDTPAGGGTRPAPRATTLSGEVPWTTLGVCVSTSLAVLPTALLGALAVFVRSDLDFTEAGVGAAAASFFVAAAAASIPGGRLAEWLGAKQVMLVAAALSFAVLGAISLFATRLAHLIALMAVAGVGNGLAQPAGNVALAQQQRVKPGIAFALRMSSIPLSYIAAGISVPALAETVGWRSAYALAAIMAVPVYLMLRLARVETKDLRAPARRVGEVLPLALLALGVGVGNSANVALTTFLVEFLTSVSVRPSVAGLVLSGGMLCAVCVRVFLGLAADRADRPQILRVATMLAGAGMGFFAFGLQTRFATLLIVAILIFTLGWGWVGILMYTVATIFPRSVGTASGVVQMTLFLGSAVGPMSFGLIVERWSYSAGWATAGGAAVLAASILVLTHTVVRRAHTRAGDPDGARG